MTKDIKGTFMKDESKRKGVPKRTSISEREGNHLCNLLNRPVELMDRKYTEGAIKHGGDLLDKTPSQLVDEAIGEAIDQLVYLLTLKEKLTASE